MSVNSIGNFLTIIRNGVKISKPFIVAPYSKMNRSIAELLKKEGFVRDVLEIGEDVDKKLKVVLKYVDGESVIHELTRISKLSRRTYKKVDEIKPVIGQLGVSILTTDRGVISHKEAQKLGVGGEVICTIW